MQDDVSTTVSRRAVIAGLGGLGVAGAAGAIGIGAATAAAGAEAQPIIAAGSATKTGYSYKVLHATDFFPRSFSIGRSYVQTGGLNGGVAPTASGAIDFAAPIDLPSGSVLKEVEFYFSQDATGTVNVGISRFGPEINIGDDLAFDTTNAAAGRFFVTETVDTTMDTARYRYVAFCRFLGTPGQQRIEGARIGYVASASGFQPTAPQRRVLDSRNGAGKLTSGAERVVSLAPYVPASAKAALVNLTVVATEGAGFIGAYPANTAWPGTSSVNWFGADQTLANAAITAVDTSAQIKLYCGAGAAEVIVDLLGFFG